MTSRRVRDEWGLDVLDDDADESPEQRLRDERAERFNRLPGRIRDALETYGYMTTAENEDQLVQAIHESLRERGTGE